MFFELTPEQGNCNNEKVKAQDVENEHFTCLATAKTDDPDRLEAVLEHLFAC